MLRAIDSHMHGDILIQKDENFPNKYYKSNVGGIIWAYNENIKKIEEYPAYWDFLKNFTYKISKENSPFYYKIGVHPRTICNELKNKKEFPTILKKALEKHIKDPKCVGIGEIGLEDDDINQKNIFIEHLKWCKDYLPDDKKIGIHTPRKNKYNITKKTLDILQEYKTLYHSIILDHIELASISLLKNMDFYIGITLQKGKTNPEDIKTLVKEKLYDLNKIVLNSDGGKMISTPYFDFVTNDFIDGEIKKKLLKDNVISCYNLKNH